MKYNNRIYPHPVLGIGNTVEDNFEVSLTVSTTKGEISINLEYKLSNKDILELIKLNKAKYCVQIYCKGTLYREMFSSKKPLPKTIKIPAVRLHEHVEADFFVCANDEIKNYSNSKFEATYKGYTFPIDKGDILAYGGKGIFYANKSFEELKSISAFMNIDSGSKKKMPMYNYYEGDKITIYLSASSYKLYQQIRNEKSYIETLHSSVVLPALAEAVRFLKSDDSDDYSDRKWYSLLENLAQKNSTDDPLQTAQKILDHPVNRSFESLYEIIK